MKYIHHPIKLPTDEEYFLSLLSGSEAGVATTAAIILGLEANGQSSGVISAAAVIAVLVEAFNTAAIRYSEDRTENEIEDTEAEEGWQPGVAATLQFVLHVIFGSILLFPVLFLDSIDQRFFIFGFALVLLFAIGLIKGRFVKRNTLEHALEIVLVGLLVIAFGIAAGSLI